MSLREELERIAGQAPQVVVAPDTWARARRARRRERAGVVALVVCVLAVVGSLAWLPERDGVDPAGSDSLGVPDRLHAVPEQLTGQTEQGEWTSDEVTDDPTVVEVGAAAWVLDCGLPVVVDAARGAYHLLDLPDFLGNHRASVGGLPAALELSPDGRRLAFAYAVIGPEAETEPIPSGVRVVDLATGAVQEVPVPGAEGTAVTRIAWSPDGSRIAFLGMQQSYWTADSMGTSQYLDHAGPVLGRISVDTGTLDVRAVASDELGVEVDDEGTVTFGHRTLQRWDGRRSTRVTDTSGRDLVMSLGRLDDGSRLWLAGSSPYGARAVTLVTPDGARRPVVELPPSGDVGPSLSLAVDLMDADRPTVRRPGPDWPLHLSEGVLSVLIGLGVAGAIALAMGLRLLWRRWAQRRSAR